MAHLYYKPRLFWYSYLIFGFLALGFGSPLGDESMAFLITLGVLTPVPFLLFRRVTRHIRFNMLYALLILALSIFVWLFVVPVLIPL